MFHCHQNGLVVIDYELVPAIRGVFYFTRTIFHVKILPYKVWFFADFSAAVLYVDTEFSTIVLISWVNSGSSKWSIGAVRPRAMDKAEERDVAFALTVIELCVIGCHNLVAFLVALTVLPSSSMIDSNCKYSGNNSICADTRRRFSFAFSPSLLIKIKLEFVVPKL